MFDAETIKLIRSAPPLQGLDLKDLPKQLTRENSTIVLLRMRLRESAGSGALEPELAGVVERLESLAPTQEAFVAATPNRPNRASAAFVAATAHQLCFSAQRLRRWEATPSLLGAHAIAPEIAAAIMFLVAGRLGRRRPDGTTDQFCSNSVDADVVRAMQKIDALFAQGDGPSN
jgi:hypothetical protein